MDSQSFPYLRIALQLAFAAGAGVLCVAACRWSSRVWTPLGLVVAVGVIARAWSGLALFTISYFNLPVLASLHTGDGFWHLAPDARVYYDIAASTAMGSAIPVGSPSPSFLEMLALWMRAAGIGPASALLFNLVLYVASCVMLIAAFRPLADAAVRRAALVTLSIFSFSPVLILLGTQTLKDVFFAFLVVCATVALFRFLATLAGGSPRGSWILPLGIVMSAVFLIAGVRAYYALLIWGAVCAALALRLVTLPRGAAVRSLPRAALAVVLLWCSFMWGAGDYYPYYGSVVSSTLNIQLPFLSPDARRGAAIRPSESVGVEAAFSSVHALRLGFVRTGGATSLAKDDGTDGRPGLAAMLLGVAAMLVPITALMQLSLVDFRGGRGFLLITDLDTLFVDATLVAVVWVLLTSRRTGRSNLPLLAFGVALAVVSAVLLGYVVTNYGTLFRLRLLATVPIWILPLALTYWRSGGFQQPGSGDRVELDDNGLGPAVRSSSHPTPAKEPLMPKRVAQ